MIDTMNKRQKWKAALTEEGRKKYKSMNNRLHRAPDKAHEMWRKEQCDETEKLDKQWRIGLMHRKVKELTKNKNRQPTTSINDRDGNKQTESRWKESIEDLYN